MELPEDFVRDLWYAAAALSIWMMVVVAYVISLVVAHRWAVGETEEKKTADAHCCITVCTAFFLLVTTVLWAFIVGMGSDPIQFLIERGL